MPDNKKIILKLQTIHPDRYKAPILKLLSDQYIRQHREAKTGLCRFDKRGGIDAGPCGISRVTGQIQGAVQRVADGAALLAKQQTLGTKMFQRQTLPLSRITNQISRAAQDIHLI